MRLEADPGHVKGLVGSFYVRSGDNTSDGYDAVIDWLEQTTNSRSGISLDRRILSPEEWIENPYFSGPYARDFLWPEKKRVFIEAAQGNISEVLLTGALGVGKCLTGDATILDGRTGRKMTMLEAVGQQVSVPSLQGDGTIKFSDVAAVWQSGVKNCLTVHTASGLSCGMSYDHPVLTKDGWKPIQDVQVGELIAAARNIPDPQVASAWTDAEIELFGHLLANGSCSSSVRFHTGHPEVRRRVIDLASQLPEFRGLGEDVFRRGCHTIILKGLTEWARKLGLDSLSKEKRIPAAMFGIPTTQICLLLRALWTDGYVPDGGGRPIELILASEGLIDDVHFLLRRVGIVSRKSFKLAKCEAKKHNAWRLHLGGVDTRRRFLEVIGPIPGREAACAEHLASLDGLVENTNWDVVPITYQDSDAIRRETGPWPKKTWSYRLAPNSHMGSKRFARMLQETGYQGPLADVLKQDVFWDTVEAKIPLGMQPVYDLTVPDTGNFVANGLVVHNTALLLCLAAYDVYRASCLTSAQAFLGFPATSKLAWVLVHQNETKAKDKLLDPLLQFFDSTPYFQRDCPRDRSLTSRAYFPKKNLVVRTGVTSENAIHGDDVIFIGVTEANFLPVINDSTKKRGGEVLDVATDIIENAYRRWESRFLRDGQLQLCRIVVDSSRQYPDDALELREKRALRGDLKYPVRVFSFSQWEAKRGVRDNNGNLLYSGETFPVEVASGNRASRILELDEVPHAVGRVVWCAVEHRSSFEESIDASLRDLAGVAVEGLRPLFPQREAISDCIRVEGDGHMDYACRHPFTATTTSMRDAVEFLPALLADPNTRRPLVNPNMLRVVHCDPSVTGDAFGFAMGHVSEIVTVNRLVDGRLDIKCTACTPLGESGRIRCPRCQAKGVMVHFGRTTTCQMCRGAKVIICPGCKGSGLHGTPLDRPRIYLDMALRILPPKAGRIQFDDVAALLDKLRAIGFQIAVVTADGHQSEYFIQRQAQIRGVMLAERVSVDLKKDPYYAFRDAVMDIATDGKRRFSMYDYPPLFDELCHLEDRRDKVDHPKSGEKDISDGVAGVVYNCERLDFLREPCIPGAMSVVQFGGRRDADSGR